jgi:DNA-binding LacI/PurR family transcriptional regulator
MKRVTIKDVAKEARVSIATVSRVVNGTITDKVMEARVKAAIRDLNYQPNRRARGLRTNDTRVIGLLISDIENPFFTALVRGVEDVAQENQMNVILCNSDESITKQKQYLRALSQEGVAGLIIAVTAGTTIENLQSTIAPDIPFTLLDRDIGNEEFDVVTVDNELAAYKAVLHLHEQGYSRIALVNGDLGIYSFEKRYQGYMRAHNDLNLPVNPKHVVHIVPKIDPSYESTLKLLHNYPEIDALFTANNLITLGSLKAIQELELRIPEDIGVVGFDDMPWLSILPTPITSIMQPTYEIGQTSMQLLLKRIASPDAVPVSVKVQTKLIVRKSSRKN